MPGCFSFRRRLDDVADSKRKEKKEMNRHFGRWKSASLTTN
jgi:hypothetical protein